MGMIKELVEEERNQEEGEKSKGMIIKLETWKKMWGWERTEKRRMET